MAARIRRTLFRRKGRAWTGPAAGDPMKSTLTAREAPPPPFRLDRTWIVPALTWCVCLALTLTFWRIAEIQEQHTDAARFAELSGRMTQAIDARLRAHERVLFGLRGLFAASKSVERGEFREFTKALQLSDTPGATGHGFVRYVPPGRLEAFLRATRADEAADFQAYSTGGHPDSMIVEYIEPLAAHAGTRGLDLGGIPEARAAATEAVVQNRATLSAPFRQAGPDPRRTEFLLFHPIYTSGAALGTVEERWHALVGWVYTPLLMNDLVADIAMEARSQVDIEIFDGPAVSGSTVLFDLDGTLIAAAAVAEQTLTRAGRLLRQSSLQFGNRTWTAQISTLPAFAADSEHRLPWVVLLAGLVLTGFAGHATTTSRRARRLALIAAREMTASLRDEIAERERIDEVLRSVSRFQDAILRSASHAIISTTPEGIIRVFNPAAERMLGYTSAELVDRQTPAMFHDPAEVAERAGLFSAELGVPVEPGFDVFVVKSCRGLPNEHEWTYIRKDGSRLPVSLAVTAVRNEQGDFIGFLGLAVDITERKEQARALQLAKDSAESANRAKSAFLAVMSHEIRTPLNAVLGFAELLNESSLDPEQREFVGTIRASGQGLLDLINDILDYSKIEAGKMAMKAVDCDALPLAHGVVRILSMQAERKGLTLAIEIAPGLSHTVNADPARLRQVLMNLVGNALKFTAQGGVTIRLSPAEFPGRDGLKIAVADTGPGIAPDQQQRLFHEFVQVDASYSREAGGTGLGLAICKRLVGMMGGQIGFDSAVGQGSTFWFTLPGPVAATVETPAGAVGAGAPLTDSPPGRGAPERPLRVLLVDDNPVNRKLALAFLAKLGCEVSMAHDGFAAVGLARTGAFDLALMDCQMPVMDGFEATREIRAAEARTGSGRRMPIIALTASAIDSRDRCYAAGMDSFLTKPYQLAELREAIAAVLHGIPAPATARGPLPSTVGSTGGTPGPRAIDVPPRTEITVPPLAGAAMDRARALRLADSNPELLALLGQSFLSQVDRLRAAIQRALTEQNPRALREHAHALKGSLAIFAADGAWAAAAALEQHAPPPDWAELARTCARLESELARLRPEIAELGLTEARP